MEQTAGHTFTSGRVLSDTFAIFFANFMAFGVIVLIILSPTFVGQGWLILAAQQDPNEFSTWSLVLMLLGVVLSPLATAALTYGVFQQVRSKPVSVGDCFSVGFSRMFPVLGVGILVGIIVMVGMVLCIIPGVIAATVLAAAVPAVVIERLGVFRSLSRSSELTKGFRWPAFGVIFGIGLLQMVVSIPVSLLATVSPMAYFLAIVLTGVIFTGLQATAWTLLYYNLRKAKETIDVEEIAAAFA